jgi:dTDP-D-glucose 4,6-dehydratase
MQPTNPYAATKAAAEFVVMSYWECFKVTQFQNDDVVSN